MPHVSRTRERPGGSPEDLSMPVVQFTCVRTSRSVSTLATVILTDETRNPVREFSDVFWSDFRTLAIRELSASFEKDDLLTAFGIFILLSLGAVSAFGQSYCGTVTAWVTASWFFHSGLIWLCPSSEHPFQRGFPIYVIVLLIVAISSAACKNWFQSVFSILLLAIASCCCPSYILRNESLASSLFLQSVNRYCTADLRGYVLSFDRGIHFLCLNFCRGMRLNIAAVVNENEVPRNSEFRVFLFDNYPCLTRAVEWDSQCYTAKGGQHMPEGIPKQAWSAFVRDISDEIESHDKDSRKLPFIMILHVLISAAFLVAYRKEGINYLLPLHMTSPFISNAVFRKMMTRKFSMVDQLGCSILGSTYRVSYHSVRWFSRCDDYILFKGVGAGEESSTQGRAVGKSMSTSVGIEDEFFDCTQELSCDDEDSPA